MRNPRQRHDRHLDLFGQVMPSGDDPFDPDFAGARGGGGTRRPLLSLPMFDGWQLAAGTAFTAGRSGAIMSRSGSHTT